MTQSTSKINVYAAGGAGINIASLLEKQAADNNPGFGKIVPIYVDTSKSNLAGGYPEDRTYLIQDLDGSGKVRRENHKQIGECVNDILYKFAPGDLNIIISSTGGGSGSVIAPSLASELLKLGQNVIVVAVGSTDSIIEVENTIKTLQSYEVISQKAKTPVAMIYYQNTAEQKRAAVNEKIKGEIVRLAILFSKQNKELDTSDLRNWLNYPRVTSYEPHLVALEVFLGAVKKPETGTVITVATLSPNADDTSTGMVVDYQAVGFIDKDIAPELMLGEAIHFALVDGYFADITRRLGKLVENSEAQKKAALQRKSIVGSNVDSTDNGLVL